ncbi:cation-transporting P-type ATPase, partial [Yersinia pestis]
MRKLEKTDANRSNNKKPFAIALEAKNSLEQTLFKLNTHLNGLTEEDARERLELYG